MNEMQHGMSDKIKEEIGEIKPKVVDEIKNEIRATLILSGLFLFGVGLPSRNNNLISGF
jgi:hypothetical protein